MLTNDGSSIFGAKDFQQRSTTLWIFKFAPLLFPIIFTQIYHINYYLYQSFHSATTTATKCKPDKFQISGNDSGESLADVADAAGMKRSVRQLVCHIYYIFNTPLLR